MSHRKISVTILTVIAIASFALILSGYAAVNVNATLNSSGNIITVVSPSLGLYADNSCTVPISSLDWGSLTPGGSVTKWVFIKNVQGTAPLTLGMTANNWNPTTANGPLSITWDRQGTVLTPGQSTAATITLSVSPSVSSISSFSVQISISATG